jgi:CHAT domain-containing protein
MLTNIGVIYTGLGDKQKALKFFDESLPLFRLIGNKRGEAIALNNIGKVYSDLGDKEKALNYFKQSLPIRRAIGDKGGEATTLANIGGVYFELGDKEQTLKFYNESLPLFHSIGDKRGKADTLNNIFYSLASVNPRFGVFYGNQSVNNYQILRSNVQGLDKNLQQTFLKSIEKVYRRLADALIIQGRNAEAQQVLNSFKDQQFFDFSQSKQFAPLAVTVREGELTATLNQKLENFVAAIRTLDALKRTIGERQPTADEAAQLKSLADKQTAANEDYLAFLKSAENEFAAPPTEKDKSPDVPDLTQMQTTLRELSAQTGEKTVAVYTLVGADNYRALIITSDSISSVSTPIKGASLNEKARQLWWFLHQSEYDPQPLAKEIYDAVFAPLTAKLPADTKTILWSLDGSLRYVPMAALHDGKQYLVERYNNVVFTRSDKERLTRSVSANLTGIGFGSSRRHIVKLGGESIEFSPLVYVKPELERIFKNSGSTTGVLTGETMLDAQFTRAAMISTLKKRRPLVHIASHFKFEPGDEANSFLLLGDGTAFTLDEMKRQKDLFAGVELLALSACDTAAQRENADGREVDGFAELAQRLGAGAVMASLWKVSDVSTAELMTRFYKSYNNQNGANKASALRAAQLALLGGEYKTAGAINHELTKEEAEMAEKFKIDLTKQKLFNYDKNPKFAHPYYWSPFILIGNWK